MSIRTLHDLPPAFSTPGWWDRVHWVPNGGIYTLSGQPKAGALALQRLLRTRWNTTAEAK